MGWALSGGLNPTFSHGKFVSFPIFPMGKNGVGPPYYRVMKLRDNMVRLYINLIRLTKNGNNNYILWCNWHKFVSREIEYAKC